MLYLKYADRCALTSAGLDGLRQFKACPPAQAPIGFIETALF
jgi:hypothetical protein